MKNIKIFILLLLGMLHFGVMQAQDERQSEDDILSGKIRLKFKQEAINQSKSFKVATGKTTSKEVGLPNVDKVSNQIGIKQIKRVFPFSPKFEAKHRKYGLHLWYEVEFDSSKSAKEVMKQYESIADIDIIKPIYKKTQIDGGKEPVVFKSDEVKSAMDESIVLESDDPKLSEQWHYESNDRFGEFSSDVELFEAWETTTGHSDIIVAIVDQGIDFNHEDLKDNMWQNEAEINGVEGVDDDGNGYIDDFYGYNFNVRGAITPGNHGTHVAGTVGAVGNNGIGVAGVAGGDGSGNGVKLISAQVFDSRTNGGLNFAEAIVYGADNGAVISQNSWGYNRPDYYEPEVLDAIRYFIAEAGQYPGSPMKGGILFFAAGNDAVESNRYPGAFDEVVAVSSTGPTGLPAPYTNFGDWVDICAPGGDMTNFGEEGGVLSTITNNQYGYIEGTSMACPHVSGVAALVLAKNINEGNTITPDDLRRIIINSTTPFRFIHNSKYGKGILNAAKALVDDNRIPPNAITDLRAAESFHNEIRLAWTVPNDDDGFSPSYYYLAIGEEPITASNFENQGLFLVENNVEAGQTFNINIGGLIKETDYWFAVKSLDQFENISEISNILATTTSSEPHFMESTKSIDLTIDVTDNPLANVPVTFSNISEGIIYWESLISNETYFRPLETASASAKTVTYKSDSIANTSNDDLGEPFEAIRYLTDSDLSQASLSSFEHWKNDTPEYIAGLSYENGTPPAFLAGTGNTNAGLIMGTRFDIPYDFSFNLTHLEVALFPETNEFPITIEIRKGSRNDMNKAETVYQQEYYPDVANEFKYYRIPIYKPQKFQDNESFWVVFNFPKEMLNPQVMQFGGGEFNERFVVSRDNGRTYIIARDLLFRPAIPMLRAFSTGENGSFVFLDPNNGEIQEFSNQDINITVDANNLTNGNHLASVGVLTNDIHKPVVNIELKLEVVGQVAVVDNTALHEYEVFTNVENDLELEVENKGLSNFEVYGYTVEGAGNTEVYADTLIVNPGNLDKVPFKYTPSLEGAINDKITLNTNIGDLPFALRLISEQGPDIALSVSASTIDVNYESKRQVSLSITNNGTGASLNYDLNHYNIANKNSGLMGQKLHYTMSSSLDIDGPAANLWDDISDFGTVFSREELRNAIPLGMKFPFFNQMMESLSVDLLGTVNLFGYRALVPLNIQGSPLNVNRLIYHAFGDKIVLTFECHLMRSGSKGYAHYGDTVEFQVVLFKNGAIEYRYKDVDDVTPDKDYTIYVQGILSEDKLTFRDYGDTQELVNGLVVRFTPDRTISMIGETNKLEGTILSGNTEVVNLNIEPKAYGLTEGTYNDTIVVYNNTAAKFNKVPVVINVSGTPEVTVNDSVHFKEPVFIGASKTKYLKVENKGAQAINITALSSGLAQFTIDASVLPIMLNATSNVMLPVTFTPTNSNELVGNVTVGFEDGSIQQAVLRAKGLDDAHYTHDLPLPISVSLGGGEKTSVPFNITNTSSAVGLEYVFRNSTFASVANESTGKAIGANNRKATEDYGYAWKLSDSLKVFHKWDMIDLNEGRLELEENGYTSVELPFEFPFYGEYYSTIWISINGYISVKKPSNQPGEPTFVIGDDFNGVIAPLWTNLKLLENNNGLNYKLEDDTLVVQWYKLVGQNASMSPGEVSFQVEINNDGYIKFHYDDIETWGGLIQYGIKSPDGTEFLQEEKALIMSWANIKNHTSYIIAPPQVGSVSTQQQEALNLTVSAEDIYYPGIYSDTISLVSNSNSQKTLEVPVEIHVTGAPKIAVTDTLSWDNIVFRNNLILTKTLKITNKGYDILKVTQIASEGLDGFNLYDEAGNKIIRSSSGVLLSAINIKPWETVTLTAEIAVLVNQNQIGKIIYTSNSGADETVVEAAIVDSPMFSWNAQDQEYTLTNIEKEVYTFNIENKGDSKLFYNLSPATVPQVAPTPTEPYISDLEGEYDLQKRVTVDSLAIETKEVGDGVFTPFAVGANLAFSNRFTAPTGGFSLTHVRAYTYLDKIEELITVMVYKGGDLPQDGVKLYEQQFVINQRVDSEWIYFPLEQPFFIPEGEQFYIIVTLPVSNKYMGFDNSEDESILEESFSGVYQGNEKYYWWANYVQSMRVLWKIRPLTASGKNQWLTLDTYEGEVLGGETVAINATIDPEIAGKGTHSGKIIATSNDINNPREEVTITLNVNGAPELNFYPNIYKDTLNLVETESKVFNYLFEDVEGDAITVSIDDSIKGIEYELTQTDANTAQVTVETDYESEGNYKVPLAFTDAVGNVTNDTIVINVIEKNRAPIFNTDYEVVTLNLADKNSAVTIDPNEIFTDPDGDVFQFLAGNYNPEVVDMAFGNQFINLNPIKVGTGQLVFAADDGKEDGFVIHLVYVNVIDDSETASGVPDGLFNDVHFDASDLPAIFTPNPVVNGMAKLYYKLDETADVSIQLFNSNGQLQYTTSKSNVPVGEHVEVLSLNKLAPGFYICVLNAEDKAYKSFKIIVK
ncbi:S8 family serine peptidase [Tamlana fucoidanivorans]|uniref:T9SS type A sorting domain-containing protein n=1 Tax=Allotamlana fucoidanivorans TaxID=2583814 RepID=A0A5C4SGQ9_9FLAO|nr:S8 family serine peptidase [Tamlana fucoidanivorans]TNJ42888.1 T9SS type A sorting domain-containing protein [Tamlana fucoidanivorans]